MLKARGNPPAAIEDVQCVRVQLRRDRLAEGGRRGGKFGFSSPDREVYCLQKVSMHSQCTLADLPARRETADAGDTCQITRFFSELRVQLQTDPLGSQR